MSGWDHGYYTDNTHGVGYDREIMPVWLHWAAALQGVCTPVRRFRYLDMGCGQGLSLLIAAAAHPEAEFIGIDFMPAHVRHGQDLAAAAGLQNIRFLEADFSRPDALAIEPGDFDYVVAHGVWSWVSPEVRSGMLALAARLLRPGGLLYVSYNTLPGWASDSIYQKLVQLEMRRHDAPAALVAAMERLVDLQRIAPRLFEQFPALRTRMASFAHVDMPHLLQEYGSGNWQPWLVADVQAEMRRWKLDPLGTATLAQALLPRLEPGVEAWLQEQDDPAVRVQAEDWVRLRAFRRDLFVRGLRTPWPGERERCIRDLWVMIRQTDPLSPDHADWTVQAGEEQHQLDPDRARVLIELLQMAEEPVSVGELMDVLGGTELGHLVSDLALLSYAGWVWLVPAPVSGEAPDAPRHEAASAAVRLNRVLCRAARQGAPYQHLAVPGVAQAIQVDALDWLLLEQPLCQGGNLLWRSRLAGMEDGFRDAAAIQRRLEHQRTLQPFLRRQGAL